MRAFAARRDAAPEALIGRVLCHDAGKLRKGHALQADDLPALFHDGRDEVHLLELGPDDVGQKEAGRRLAEAILSVIPSPQGISSRRDVARATRSLAKLGMTLAPAGHRHVLRADHDGLLDIDVDALHRMNSIPGIAVFTPRNGEVVSTGQVVTHAQILPLAIDRRTLEAAEQIAREQPIVRVHAFTPRDAIFWKRDDRLVAPLTETLKRFRCELAGVHDLPHDAASIRASLGGRLDTGATLCLIAGTNALDPLDPVFVALEQLGATMRQRGLAVHPGTLLWIASRGGATIVGLPSCGLRGGFELVLPRLLIDGAPDLAALGHGGAR